MVKWTQFVANKDGNFGLFTALLIVPMLGVAGLAIDYSNAIRLKSDLMDAADAAALAAIADQSQGVAKALAMKNDGTVSFAADDGRNFFLAATGARFPDAKLDVDITVTKKSNNLKSELSFSAIMQTTLLQIIGKKEISVSGTVVATYQLDSFIDFYMLLDNTPSMGVGATPSDVTKLVEATSDKCAFACHIVKDGVEDMNSYYNVAKRIGATIRIDVVAKAAAAMMREAISTQRFPSQFRVATFTFGENAIDAGLFEVSKLTADLVSVRKATEDIKLMSIPYQGYNNDQQTSFDKALTKLNAEIDEPGNGTSITNREKIVFFVADGVGDSYKPKACTKKVTGQRCQEPIDTKYCEQIKDRGIKIAVLYTTYLPLPTNKWYNNWIKPFQNEIGPRMEECASPGLYFEVSPTEGIEDAMKALFIKAVRSPRIES